MQHALAAVLGKPAPGVALGCAIGVSRVTEPPLAWTPSSTRSGARWAAAAAAHTNALAKDLVGAYADLRNKSRDIPLSGFPAEPETGDLTMGPTRRRFLGSAAAVAAALGIDGFDSSLNTAPPKDLQPGRSPGGLGRGALRQPQVIYRNARVYTMDERVPRADAFAIEGDRFLAVGTADDVLNLADAGTQVIDCGGMTIVPGFIDSHSHPSGVNEMNGVNVNLRTVEEVKAVLAAKAATTPPGFWVRGYMYDDTKLDRPVTRVDLDEAVPNHLASVGHRGGHTGVYNSMAFEQAGISSNTPPPPDG